MTIFISDEKMSELIEKYVSINKKYTAMTHEYASQLSNIPLDTLKKLKNKKSLSRRNIQKLEKFLESYDEENKNINDKDINDNRVNITDAPKLLVLAKKAQKSQKWGEMTSLLTDYVLKVPKDAEGHFLLGVGFANLETDASSTSALASYSNALLFSKKSLKKNRHARYLTYRGAMFKRLGRISEATIDFKEAQKYASNYYEAHNIIYNLACIYAIEKERKLLFDMLNQLSSNKMEMSRIRSHLNDYFIHYKTDKDFLKLINYYTD